MKPGDKDAAGVRRAPISEVMLGRFYSEEWRDELRICETAEQAGAWLSQKRSELIHRPCLVGEAAALGYRHTALVDALIDRLFEMACQEASPRQRIEVSVAATGGYGRMEMSPHSDVDITFIPARDGDEATERVIRRMFHLMMTALMDGAGMKVGYAYRLIEDCGNLDHGTQTTLIDARLITGSRNVFARFLQEYWSMFNRADFIFQKIAERRQVRSRYGTTPYTVEPQLKEGAGGLRDWHMVRWLGAALAGISTGGELSQVVDAGLLSADQAFQMNMAQEFLQAVRFHLHVLAGEQRDILSTQKQEAVCAMLKYRDSGAIPAVERFMHDYYMHSAILQTCCDRAMKKAEGARHVLGIGLDVAYREVIPSEAIAGEDPSWMVWAVRLAQRYGLTFSPELEELINQTLESGPVCNDPKQLADGFLEILRQPDGVASAIRLMARTGILQWILPEFARTVTLIPYDPSHEYTVGEHSLRVVDNIQALNDIEDVQYKDFRRVYHEMPQREVLYLAALLHDAGKAETGDHCVTGDALAAKVGARLYLSEDAIADLRFAVRHHLLMASTSRMRDLEMDETVDGFVQQVVTLDRLNLLYLLGYADEKAVGAGVWTEAKAGYLRELYQRTMRWIEENQEADAAPPDRGRFVRRLLRGLSQENIPEEQIRAHVEAMPANYLVNTPQEVIGLHVRMIQGALDGQPQLQFYTQPDGGVTEITIVTLDDPQPGLLAKIAGVLYASQVTVHGARVMTRKGDPQIALDALTVDFKGRPLQDAKRAEIDKHMRAVLSGTQSVDELLTRIYRKTRTAPVMQSVSVNNETSRALTVVDIRSNDHPGALYWACTALSRLGWNIHSARVSLWAGQAVGVYYVTDTLGRKIRNGAASLRKALQSDDS